VGSAGGEDAPSAERARAKRISLLYLVAVTLALLLTMVLALVLHDSSSSPPPPSLLPSSPPPLLREDSVLFDVRFAGLEITQFADPAFDASFRTDFTSSIAQVNLHTHTQRPEPVRSLLRGVRPQKNPIRPQKIPCSGPMRLAFVLPVERRQRVSSTTKS
jgi:hypothetical protein